MILLNGTDVKFESFPNGESKLLESSISKVSIYDLNDIKFKYENDGDLIKLRFVKMYLDTFDVNTRLCIYYMPYSRMDRSENGSAFTLKYITEFINDLYFHKVYVVEPHSDVTTALLDSCIPLYKSFDLLPKVEEEVGFNRDKDYLFFPDAGAQKRYHSLTGYKQLVGYKNRDFTTGKIESLQVIGKVPYSPESCKIIIVDDLSSYGTTFVKSSEALRELGFKEIYLLVIHAEDSIFHGDLFKHIDKIFTTNSILSHQELIDNKTHLGQLKVYKLEDIL